MAGEREETAGVAGVSLGVMHYLAFYVSAYAAARPETERNIPQKGLYQSIPGRVLAFGPRVIHGNWTWKPACAADVRLMRASRKVIAAKMEGMVDRG
jgi:hypothetical protein